MNLTEQQYRAGLVSLHMPLHDQFDSPFHSHFFALQATFHFPSLSFWYTTTSELLFLILESPLQSPTRALQSLVSPNVTSFNTTLFYMH